MPVSRRTLEIVVAALDEGKSLQQAADAALVSLRQARDARGRARMEGLLHDPLSERIRARRGAAATKKAKEEPPATLEERLSIGRLKSERSDLQRQLRETEAHANELQATLRAAVGLRECPADPLRWPEKMDHQSGNDVPMMLWSDWHIGETVIPAQVRGVNRYDRETAEARVERLVDRTIYLATMHITHPYTDRAVLFLDGDFVSGWQHDELMATDWCTPLQAVRYAAAYLCGAIEKLLSVFARIMVVCCPGNHGRLFEKKTPAKIEVFQSFDYLIYGFVEEHFRKDARVVFATPETGDYLLTVYRTRYFVMHGHAMGVKGRNALIGLIGPMVRGRLKVGRSNASFGADFDVLVTGHFHQTVWLPGNGLIVNNCLVGFNEYARKQRYEATPPSQMLWFTSPIWGPVSPYQVFVDEPVPFQVQPEMEIRP